MDGDWLAIDRSTDAQSVALARRADGGTGVTAREFPRESVRNGSWPLAVRAFLKENGSSFRDLSAIIVGTGPGSFAGIRGALAFAQGIALGSRGRTTVRGLPSALALAREGERTAVVGDARRGRFWVLLCDGVRPEGDFSLVDGTSLAAAVPDGCAVATPDGARIGGILETLFGARYSGSTAPSARRLAEIAAAHPNLTVPEPLPVHLTEAVRGD